MKIVIERFASEAKQTRGHFRATGKTEGFNGVTLELPWLENQKDVSCIPAGSYKFELYNSVKFGQCFHVLEVPGRDAILTHAGNYNSDTHGCILPGAGFADLNQDGIQDITSSRATMEKLLALWDGSGELVILNVYK